MGKMIGIDLGTTNSLATYIDETGEIKFIKNELSSISANLQISKLIMPWRRMFEVDMDVEYVD